MSIEMRLEDFPHLTSIEWEALHRMATMSGMSVVTTLLRTGSPDDHRLAAHQFLERELADARQRGSTPAPPRAEVVKMQTSTYSGVGKDRLPLNRWFREVDLAIASHRLGEETSKVNFLISRLEGKAKEWVLGRLVYQTDAFPP